MTQYYIRADKMNTWIQINGASVPSMIVCVGSLAPPTVQICSFRMNCGLYTDLRCGWLSFSVSLTWDEPQTCYIWLGIGSSRNCVPEKDQFLEEKKELYLQFIWVWIVWQLWLFTLIIKNILPWPLAPGSHRLNILLWIRSIRGSRTSLAWMSAPQRTCR